MHKKSKRRSVAYIVSLLLTVFISIFIVLTISNFTVFNANYLLSKMESVNFYQEVSSNKILLLPLFKLYHYILSLLFTRK